MTAEPRFDVLLVDDRAENLVALEAALSQLGQNVVKARSGKEALRHLLTKDFVVVLLDVNMPELDGFETAAMIRQRKRSSATPIIFMTAALSSDRQLARGYALGAVDYLFTPIEPEILRAKVAAFVDLARRSKLARTQAEEQRAVAEMRAARLESRLQTLVSRLDVGVFRSTVHGRLVDANPTLLRLLDLDSIEDASGAHALFDDPRVREIFTFRGEVQVPPQEQVVEYVRRDGQRTWISVTKTLSSALEEPRFVEGLVADVTTRKAAETEREQLLASERAARTDAEIANRAKDEFLATLSHELRTPLHAIVGWAEVLRHTNVTPDDLVSGIDAIERNARIQTRLIDDLLDMSRINSGKLRLELKSIDVAALVAGVADSLQPTADAKAIVVTRAFDPLCAQVSVDAGRLQQVAWNLLSNAVKFTPKQGHVEVSLRQQGPWVELSVQDDGEGIAPEFLPQVFERFRQADASTTRRHGGLGLGLAIVKHLVEMHGGSVVASSDGVGKGARFTVLLPALAVVAVAPSTVVLHGASPSRVADEEERRPRLEGVRVLVVDDVPDARELMRRVIEESGATVAIAESATSALAQLEREVPDVLVSDVGMPGEDGYALIARVRALSAKRGGAVPAVALTSFVRNEDRTRALAAGYDEHLAKPIEPWRLVRVLAELSASGRSRSGTRARTASPAGGAV